MSVTPYYAPWLFVAWYGEEAVGRVARPSRSLPLRAQCNYRPQSNLSSAPPEDRAVKKSIAHHRQSE
jgi:hypothetical protein